jgi:hypothetical protein
MRASPRLKKELLTLKIKNPEIFSNTCLFFSHFRFSPKIYYILFNQRVSATLTKNSLHRFSITKLKDSAVFKSKIGLSRSLS